MISSFFENNRRFKNLISYTSILFYFVFAACTEQTKEAASSNSNDTLPELSVLNEKIMSAPNNADLYHQRANYFFENKDFEAAMADMGRALKIDSAKSDYYYTLSDIYFVTNKTSKSKAALEKSIALNPQNTKAVMKLAELYYYVKQYKESIQFINKVLEQDQYNAKAYFMKGMNYKEFGDTGKAISSMQTAVEQDPEYYAAFMQLGLLHAAQKNSLAVDYYNNVLRINSGSIEAYYGKAKFYQDIKEWKNAIASYDDLLKVDPEYKYAYYNLGVIHFLNLKLYDKAIGYFENAIKADPQYFEAYYAKGSCYQAMGDMNNALQDYKTVLRLNPNHTLALEEIDKIIGKKSK